MAHGTSQLTYLKVFAVSYYTYSSGSSVAPNQPLAL